MRLWLLFLLLSLAVLAEPIVFGDWRQARPGQVHHIKLSDLPAPDQAEGDADTGPSSPAPRKGAIPVAPAGYEVSLFASGLENPRALKRAPNGDIWVAESRAHRVSYFKGKEKKVFASDLGWVFGIAFAPGWVYVANDAAVFRIPEAGGKPVKLCDLPRGGKLRGGGHWTRDLCFSADGKRLFVAVGSFSNVSDNAGEKDRACILSCNPDGSDLKVYASGLRNPVGLTLHPTSGELWTTVNERDGLGDNLPPDYVTHVEPGGFYGWPWFYMGGIQDPRHKGAHPELQSKVITPDVLVQPHSACLGLDFWNGDLYVAQHGSWNRSKRTGYAVIRIPFRGKTRPAGEYEDFLTGFLHSNGDVWGRPVGVVAAADGSLLVSDDFSESIWRVVKK